MYRSTLPLTSALYGEGGQRQAPASLPPGKSRYPLCSRLGGPQGRSELVGKISPSSGFDPRTVQPVTSRYTNCAISVPMKQKTFTVLSLKLYNGLQVLTYFSIPVKKPQERVGGSQEKLSKDLYISRFDSLDYQSSQ